MHNYGIAIVGCGAIVNAATLPMYKKYDLNVIGCYDRVALPGHLTAGKFNLPRIYSSLAEIANDPRVDIVEIAVPPWEQPAIAKQMILAGKHLLYQKPLCDDINRARELVHTAEVLGVKLAVNQQLRWGPSVLRASELMGLGYVGRIRSANFHISVHTDWSQWSWLPSQPRLEILYHSIHYLDTIRHWFGEPEWVTSRHAHTDPDVAGESKTLTVLDYANGVQVLIDDNHHNTYGAPRAYFTIVGDGGEIRGTLGSMYDYPNTQNDDITYRGMFGEFSETLNGSWIPDAFIGPIKSLMYAIHDDTEPETSGADNLKTLALVDACYTSMDECHSMYMGPRV